MCIVNNTNLKKSFGLLQFRANSFLNKIWGMIDNASLQLEILKYSIYIVLFDNKFILPTKSIFNIPKLGDWWIVYYRTKTNSSRAIFWDCWAKFVTTTVLGLLTGIGVWKDLSGLVSDQTVFRTIKWLDSFHLSSWKLYVKEQISWQ